MKHLRSINRKATRLERHDFAPGEAIIVGFIRFLGVMTPVVVLIGIPGFLLLRFLWRRVRRRMAARAAAPAQ